MPPRHIEVADAPTRKDPTGTSRLRAKMRTEGDRRWQTLARTLRQALTEHDLLGMQGVGRLPHGDKAEGFAQWLREELRQKVYGFDGRWLVPYVREAAAIAQHRATELAAGAVDPARVATMATLAASELRGICEAAQQQLTRAVTHCLMANASPTRTANAAAGVIRTMRNRTRAMSEYVIAKTHATATLSAFRNAGVTRVGIIPERLRKPRIVQTAHGKVLKDAGPEDEPRDEHGRWTTSGGDLGQLYHGSGKKLKEIDPGQLQNRDPGFYGSGFYTAQTKQGTKGYGHVVTKVGLDPKARVLLGSLKAEEAPPGLVEAVKQYELERGLPGAQARGKEAQWREYVNAIPENHLEWKNALNRYAEGHKYDVVRYSPSEVVIKNLHIIKSLDALDYSPDQPRDPHAADAAVLDRPPRTGPGSRVSREETPSASTIARIERAQEKLEAELEVSGVEVVTQGDDLVCPTCEEISDAGPYDLDEAEGLIPAHAFCRCSFVAADDYQQDVMRMSARPRKQRELFYWGDDHQAHDAALHNFIIANGDQAKAQRVSREVGRRLGLNDADIDALFAKPKVGADAGFGRGARDYSPEQPRVPAGSPEGGEFASGGWSGEPLKGSSGDPGLISTALTTAKGRTKAEREQIKAESPNYQRIDLAQAKKDPELFAGMVDTFRNEKLFPYMRASDFNGDAEHDSRAVIDRIKSNLRVLWDDTAQANKDLWRHWYVGAHDLVSERMKQYPSVGRAAMTAAYAAMSPNTMWDVNVHLGDRLLDTVFNHASDKWDKGMADAAQGQLERTEKALGQAKNTARSQKNLEAMRGIFGEVERAGAFDKQKDDYHRAAWVKLWNDAHDATPVREVGIDGKLGKPIKNKGLDDNGEPSDLSGSFGPLSRIENALRALRSGGNVKEISEALGDRHKVRSFYNNILDPHAANDDVTVDTHAAGAAWLEPLGGKSPILGQMFGSSGTKGVPGAPKSARLGVMGTYPFYADAFREFAHEVGLDRGRELQSILWEHKIALFRGAPDAKKKLVHQVWQHFHDNPGMTLEQAQRRVLRIAKAGYNAGERRRRTKDGAYDYQFDETAFYSSDEG